jgi:ribosomal protein S18 acetylase RimI-like enzyme
MSYTTKILKWESDFFEKKIGEIQIKGLLKSPIVLDSEYDFELIVVKQDKKTEVTILGYTQRYTEEKIVFSKRIENSKSPLSSKTILDTDDEPLKPDLLFNLAYESGKYSRFKCDAFFKESEFERLYQTWVINSVNKTFGHKVFYIVDKQIPIAFATLNLNGPKGQIGLIAVGEQYQGQGLGKQLLKHIEMYCATQNIPTLNIPTQAQNKNAVGFYKKLGYNIIQREIIQHFWLKQHYDSI